MLVFKDLIDNVDEKYIPMLEQVSICDFTKCIAQFSGLAIQYVPDSVIKEYLLIWAEHKYPFYKMLGNKLRLDSSINYTQAAKSGISDELFEIKKDFPIYAPWLDGFSRIEKNKIDRDTIIDYSIRECIRKCFPGIRLEGTTMTHFFKRYLQAPDELVTAIGRIFENQEVIGRHTISIDPVDMMLASENPYGWDSCYRLATPNESSHADGCLAAVLDTTSLITYIWNREGKFSLYDTYDFKSIRYKRMRQWIAVDLNLGAIHFNDVYPGKTYKDEFEKTLRDKVEGVVAAYLNEPNLWTKEHSVDCTRYIERYGYGEFDGYKVYQLKSFVPKVEKYSYMYTYDTEILCPCGCGDYLMGSDVEYYDSEYSYNGEGFIAENFEERHYCEYIDDFCSHSCCEEDCCECSVWQDNNPVCDIDNETRCLDPDMSDTANGVMHCNPDNCRNCPMFAAHRPELCEEHKEEETLEQEILNVNLEDYKEVKLTSADGIQLGSWTIHYADNGCGLAYRPTDYSALIASPEESN